MVYRGKPSKSCQECRRRRVRCDLRIPGCTTCERAGKRCPGYLNQLDALFVDETASVVHRQHQPRPPTRFSKITRSAGVSDSQTHPASHPNGLPRALQPSLDEFALSYCYSRLILRPDVESSTTFYVHNPTFLKCMKAVGMAAYNSFARSPILALEAQNLYKDAIRAMNATLSSTDCVQDYTLLSVIALASLEGITDAQSLDTWKVHVDGMAALLALRGDKQLETPDGRHLFLTAMGSLAAKCLIFGIRLPAKTVDLMEAGTRLYGSEEDPLWRICLNTTHLVNLYSDILSGALTDPHIITMRAGHLDEQLAISLTHASPTWQYDIRTFPPAQHYDFGLSFPGEYHLYSHVLAAQQWNVMRSGRLICNALIRSAAVQLSDSNGPTTDSQATQASSVINQLQIDILATVAQYVGLTGDKDATTLSRQFGDAVGVHIPPAPTKVLKTANIERIGLPSLRLNHAYYLLWSLGTAGRAVGVEHPIRTTTCKALRLVGQKLGISQAFTFAAALETDYMTSGRSCSML